MSVTAPQNTLGIAPHHVQIGKYHIPIGDVISFGIFPNESRVRLWCHRGAMGIEKDPTILDFQLESDKRVKQFVAGLLEKTKAYLFSVDSLKTGIESTPTGAEARVRAEFVLTNPSDAEIFADYVAPIYFADSQDITWKDRTVTILSQKGPQAEVVAKMEKAFAELNVHTYDDRRISTIKRLRDSEKKFPHYVMTPSEAIRGNASFGQTELDPSRLKPLIRKITMDELKQVEKLYLGLIEKFPTLWNRMQPVLTLISSMIEKGGPRNEVEAEVFANRVNSIDISIADLDAQTKAAVDSIMAESGIKKNDRLASL